MNGKQTWIADRIDRRRERASAREERTARQRAFDAKAAAAVASLLGDVSANDQPDFAESLGAAVRVQLVALQGGPSASSFFGKQAYEAARDILPRKIAHAAAEQAFSRLQRPANEDHANDGDEG